MSDSELETMARQLDVLIQHRIEDIRADLRAAQGRTSGLINHRAMTVGDAAALIEIRRILLDVEERLAKLQTERSKRHQL